MLLKSLPFSDKCLLTCRSLSYTTAIRVLEEGLLAAGVYYDAYGRQAGTTDVAVSRVSRSRVSGVSATGAPLFSFRTADATPDEIAAAWSNLGKLYDQIHEHEVTLLKQNAVLYFADKTCLCLDWLKCL